MAFVRRIRTLTRNDVAVAGGKGASLGEMTQASIPVPDGFVVLSEAFEAFIQKTGLDIEIDAILDTVNHRAVHTVENASEKIHALIGEAEMPSSIANKILREHAKMKVKFVAVRSSATAEDSAEAAWAGQLETFLNTTKKELLGHVKKCWASLFSPRAIFYRFEKKMEKTKVSVAVVVQEMVESEVSGIAFSAHPVTQDRNQIIIEAGFGLGEAIVSGSITPDSFVIRKDTGAIVDTQINLQKKGLFRKKGGGSEWRDIKREHGEKPALNEKEMKELAALVQKIEKHYGFPVDIEWAHAKGRWFILQSRPITTLTAESLPAAEAQSRPLDIFLTRDAPLIAIEHWWDKGCRVAFREFFGFPYPTIISLKRYGVFTAFKDNTSGDAYIRTFGAWFRSNEKRIGEIHKRLSDGIEVFRRMKRAAGKASLRDLASMLTATSDYFSQGLPAVDAVHMLPIVHEQMKANSPLQETHLKQLIAWREKEGNYFFHEGVEAHFAILEAIAKKRSWPAELLKYVTTAELALALRTGRLPRKKLQRRHDESFALIDGKIIEEPDIEETLSRSCMRLHEVTASSVEELRGNGISKGTVQGRARIVFERNQLSRISAGDILIAPMTSPWYLPGMQKAAAFVTDEGGITCHAAILAREMNRPCVIGTKNATSIIKDGDRIEVDANRGVVKVVSKAPSDIEWVHYITRPFTLLGASFWREWYAGDYLIRTLGVTNSEARFLEVYPDVVRYYREKRQMDSLQHAAREIVLNNPKKLKAIFDRGHVLNAEAEKILKKGWRAVPDFETAMNTVIEMAIHATVIPFLTLAKFDELKVKDAKLRKTAEHLRGQSLYPRFFAEIVTPHAEYLVKKLGADPQSASLLTVHELRRQDVSQLKSRIQQRKKGLRFIYTYADNKETVEWMNNIESEVLSMEHMTKKRTNMVQGKTGYAGKVTGRARLVLTDSPKGIAFNAGDILVSINSTPALMPLIIKCAAIVTDEGGISCHAAIVSRELKKPCVMSTKLATSVIRDGDRIEVDADKGIVKVLKRA